MAKEQVIWIRASKVDEECDLHFATTQWRKLFESQGFELRKLGRHIYTEIGKSSHKYFERQLEYKLESGRNPDLDHGLDEAKKQLFDACADPAEPMEYDAKSTKSRLVAAEQLEGIARVFHYGYVPFVKPVQTEKELSLWWDGERRKVMVTATADGVLENNRGVKVHDYKTGIREPKQPLQLGVQGHLLEAENLTATEAQSIWIPRNNPEIHPIDVPVKAAMRQAEYRIDQLVRDFRTFEKHGDPGVFRAVTSSNKCKPAFCGAYGTKVCPLTEGKLDGK